MQTELSYRVLIRFADGRAPGRGRGYNGVNPYGGLIDVNGTLYGTTYDNGLGEGGTGGSVYSVSTTGTVKTLHSFGGGSDGANPGAGLTVVNGTLYGTTASGGGRTT
jgi:uncharacterized repeat protein (TIGR03803 family)